MSTKLASSNGLAGRSLRTRSLPIVTPWVRNPSWLALPDVTGLAKFAGLHAVYTDSNFLAVIASGSLGYTVDWGDGTPTENIATGVQANHQYDYAAAGLANTNAPVTLTDAGDLVTRTAHGYTDGMTVSFYNIVSTTGLTEGYTYYVISATANTFQVSLTFGGSAVALTTDGSATLLFYKQAIVTIVPQPTGTFTDLNLNVKYPPIGGVTLPAYSSGFLDIAVAGSALATLAIGGTTILMADLEQAQLIGSNAITNFTSTLSTCTSLQSVPTFNTAAGTDFTTMFNTCRSLQAVPLLNTASGTNFTSMFSSCSSLQTVGLLNTASGTNFTNMFSTCSSLQSIPLLNTASGTTFSNMFSTCRSLQAVPLFNTASGITFTSMFSSCSSLQTVPLFNTAAGTDFTSMFGSCAALQAVPLLNTASGTNFTSMFSTCSSLQTVPLLNTASGTNFTSMFVGCTALQTVPLLNTASGTTFSSMFNGCTALQTVPLFNTASGTTFSNMFSTCSSLQSIPLLNTASGTTFSNMFSTCPQLATGTLAGTRFTISYAGCKLSRTGLENIFNGLGKASGAQSFTIGTNWGAPAVVSLTGTSTAGSTLVTMASTTGIAVGMQVTGTNSPLTTAAAVTLQDAGDTVTRVAHGLSDGDEVAFATIVTTTGIATFTIYFVVGATANTFQVALTSGGAAIALTTNGSGTILYRATVTAIVVNTSVTLSRPATGTGAATMTYRLLTTGTALLKGWTVSG
jgi:Mycoplasma protein of unknown function, DUF285